MDYSINDDNISLAQRYSAKTEEIEKAKTKFEVIADIAQDYLYLAEDVEGGVEFYKRKNRISNPPGSFDDAGRFYADERTYYVNNCRTPSRAFPFSEMTAARTAAHCAELTGASDTYVRRIARALDMLDAGAATAEIRRLLKKDITDRRRMDANIVLEINEVSEEVYDIDIGKTILQKQMRELARNCLP